MTDTTSIVLAKKQAARAASCSTDTIERAIKAKELAALKRGRRVYIEPHELERWKLSWTRIGREPMAAA